MYSSLDRIDIVTEKDGRQIFHQTDHRTAAAVEEEPELSVLFALTRAIGPRRMTKAGEAPPEVQYVCAEAPPELLARALASAGAVLIVGGANGDAVPYGGEPVDPARLADEAFAALATRISQREGQPIGEALLRALELEAAAQVGGEKEPPEIPLWTGVIEIAAVCGEIMRQRIGGSWVMDKNGMATLPFAFQAGDNLANVAGKAERFLREGPSQSTLYLLAALDDNAIDSADAPLLPVLKPHDWGGLSMCVSRKLSAGPDDAPVIVLAHDRPNSVAYFKSESLAPGTDVEALHREALGNLARIEVTVEEVAVGAARLLLVTGSFYASEKLLDAAFMRSLQRRLGGPVILAAAPHKGVLIAGAMDSSKEVVAMSRAMFDQPRDTPISPVTFILNDGELQGHARLEPPAGGAPKKKGFFSRLFGRN